MEGGGREGGQGGREGAQEAQVLVRTRARVQEASAMQQPIGVIRYRWVSSATGSYADPDRQRVGARE